MRHRSKLLIAAITAIALLGMAGNAASARRLEITNWEQGFKETWRPFTIIRGANEIRCTFIVEGEWTVHAFEKVAGTRIGRVTEARVGACERGRMIILRETLPWERVYRAFGGMLPNITFIDIDTLRMGIRTEIAGLECTVNTTAERPSREISGLTSGEVTGDEEESGARIETGGEALCALAGETSFSGSAESITVRGGTSRIRFRLI